jgi:hypothetical protein
MKRWKIISQNHSAEHLSHSLNSLLIEMDLAAGIERSELDVLCQHFKELVVSVPQHIRQGPSFTGNPSDAAFDAAFRKYQTLLKFVASIFQISSTTQPETGFT